MPLTKTHKWMSVLFLVSWLSQIGYLMPLPASFDPSGPDQVEVAMLTGWTISVAMIGFGLISSVVALASRSGLVLLLISSVIYIVVWWAYSGYFDVNISLGELFEQLWAAAKVSGRELIFLHRDIVLVVFYHLMIPIVGFAIWRTFVQHK